MDPVEGGLVVNGQANRASNVVVYTVAAHANRAVDGLPPLYWSIEPDALDALVDSMERGSVEFEYADHEVTVEADGSVTVEPISERG